MKKHVEVLLGISICYGVKMHLLTLFEQEKKGDIKNCVLEGLLGLRFPQLFGEHSISTAVIFVIFYVMALQMLLCLDLCQLAATTNNQVAPVVVSINHVPLKHTNSSYQRMQEVHIVMINLCYGNTSMYATYESDYTYYTIIVFNSGYN